MKSLYRSPKFYYLFKITPGKYFSSAEREALSEYLAYAAVEHRCLGILDWSVSIGDHEKILAVESEYLDLSARAGESKPIELWFAKRVDAANMRKQFSAQYPLLLTSEVYREAKRDWMRLWRKHYRPIHVAQNGEKLWILPSWHKSAPRSKQQLQVRIHPGQAFGTGTHATTELCLRAFFEFFCPQVKSSPMPKISILDFGAGTGILGIAAWRWAQRKKLSAKLTAVEIDPEARKILDRNRKINRVALESKAKFPKRRKFRLIFANVLAPVLLAEKKSLLDSLADDGILILSGLLKEEASGFAREFFAGNEKKFRCIRVLEKEDWAAIVIAKSTRL